MHFQAMDPTADEDEAQLYGQQQAPNDAFDDVFDSEPQDASHTRTGDASHPSDMHRLETEHTTAGYREGLTAAKESSIQTGFDEGYSLGATVGLAAGQLIGILEGIAEALGNSAPEVASVLADARTELNTEKVFSPEFWTGDGNWSFHVEGEEGRDVVFADVAAAHPLIQKWTSVVDDLVAKWKIDRAIFDTGDVKRLEAQEEPVRTAAAQQTRKPLDW